MPRKLTDKVYVLVHNAGTKNQFYGRYYNAEWDAKRFATGGECCRKDKINVTVKKMTWRALLRYHAKRNLDVIIDNTYKAFSIDEAIAYLQKAKE